MEKTKPKEDRRIGYIIERINLELPIPRYAFDSLLGELTDLRKKIEQKRKKFPVPEFGDRTIIKYHKIIEQLDPNNKFKSIEEVLGYVVDYGKKYT